MPTPIMAEETMQQNADEFNRRFGLREETRPGTLNILYESWNSAKSFVQAGGE